MVCMQTFPKGLCVESLVPNAMLTNEACRKWLDHRSLTHQWWIHNLISAPLFLYPISLPHCPLSPASCLILLPPSCSVSSQTHGRGTSQSLTKNSDTVNQIDFSTIMGLSQVFATEIESRLTGAVPEDGRDTFRHHHTGHSEYNSDSRSWHALSMNMFPHDCL